MTSGERLLGFDAREMWSHMNATWPQDRKETYLLRPDVTKVLSVDRLVWPQVLDVDKSLRAPTQNIDLLLWENLQQLQDYLQQNWDAAQGPYWLIGITLLRDTLTRQEQVMWDALLTPTAPASLDKSWTFLGYDIADGGLLSGLSNCGYKASEIQTLRNRWGSYLNDWHLFTNKEKAIEFKRATDQRVPEHVPFFIYCLYSLIRS